MQLLLFIYFIFLFRSFVSGNVVFIISMIAVGILFALTVVAVRKLMIKRTKELVEKYNENPDMDVEPFVNVNRADWYVIQELPFLSRVQAKKVVWIRKHSGFYTSLDDFFKKNNINDEEQKKHLSKLIKM